MSVYTTISQNELETFLTEYDVGTLVDYRGISDGIENTNYFVDTSLGRYVLTLFETHSFEDMHYYLGLMHHLADHKVPSADPVADKKGLYLRTLKNKPAALVERLNGGSLLETQITHCQQIGDAMGKMHTAGLSYTAKNENSRGHHWFAQTAKQLHEKLDADDLELLDREIAFQKSNRNYALPHGVVHADLFKDNTLWENDTLSGIIDFYYACDDVLLYDLAVTANDWCCNENFSLDKAKTCAIIKAYHQQRTLEDIEHQLWPVVLRTAALRFWLSRLYDKHFPRPGEIVHIKNPDDFKKILTDRIDNHSNYLSYWL